MIYGTPGCIPAGMTGAKRSYDQAISPPNKAARIDSEGGGWSCQRCGNHNFEGRLTCNMRNCGAPRDHAAASPIMHVQNGNPTGKGAGIKGSAVGESWMCDKCGNHNFEGRMYCNMRTCGNPGPWTCPACGNRNFAGRKVCNMKRCNQPMPLAPPGAGPLAYSAGSAPTPAMGPQMQASQAATAAQAIAMLQSSGLASIPGVAEGIQKISGAVGTVVSPPPSGSFSPIANRAAADIKEGSWVCVECGNINFPTRDACNARLCGRSRLEVDGGPPAPGADSKTRLKPGSWVCSSCQNINWPEREACGMRKCGLPRSQVDAGPPEGLADGM